MVSDLVGQVEELHQEWNAPSASVAYNRALDRTTSDLIIFAHQDVYFPPGWLSQLWETLDWLSENDPHWGVLAPFGMVGDQHRGAVYSTSLSGVVGTPVAAPLRTSSVDELVIILNRASGLRFDPALPDWHLYGTDIVQTAGANRMEAWVAHLPVVHNDRFHGYLGKGFARAYRAVWRKWRRELPVRTPVLWLRWHGLDLALYRLRAWKSRRQRKERAGDTATDPKVFSAECGWETA
ncbi:hypothetical protein GCM10011517_25890 [Actibacterium pelagium]|uniref:Glycosyltransferase 2-like domain-containing protein n=2 Tax=Actibacterium pelagium TaxID=2029103 RepID=A0A917AKC0_9RHOB|nr:hypothetical protein GCM10011517_25890 [Actibacterium pelagium]